MEYSFDILDNDEIAKIYPSRYSSTESSGESDLDTDDEFYVSMKPDPLPSEEIEDRIVVIRPGKCILNDVESGSSVVIKKRKKRAKKRKKTLHFNPNAVPEISGNNSEYKESSTLNNPVPPITIMDDQANDHTLYLPNDELWPTIVAERLPPSWSEYVAKAHPVYGKLYRSVASKLCESADVSPKLREELVAVEMHYFLRYLRTPSDTQTDFAGKISLGLAVDRSNAPEGASDILNYLQVVNQRFRELDGQEKFLSSIVNSAENVLEEDAANLDGPSLETGKNNKTLLETNEFPSEEEDFSLETEDQNVVGTNNDLCDSLDDSALNFAGTSSAITFLEISTPERVNSLQHVESVDKVKMLVSCRSRKKLKDLECFEILKDVDSYYYNYPGENLHNFLSFREQYLCGSHDFNKCSTLLETANEFPLEEEDFSLETEDQNIVETNSDSHNCLDDSTLNFAGTSSAITFLELSTPECVNSLQDVESVDKVKMLVSCRSRKKLMDPECFEILKDVDSYYYNYSGENLQNFLNFREQYLCGSLDFNKCSTLCETNKFPLEEKSLSLETIVQTVTEIDKDSHNCLDDSALNLGSTSSTTTFLENSMSEHVNSLQNVESVDKVKMMVSCKSGKKKDYLKVWKKLKCWFRVDVRKS